jgi:hypothetical protein
MLLGLQHSNVHSERCCGDFQLICKGGGTPRVL